MDISARFAIERALKDAIAIMESQIKIDAFKTPSAALTGVIEECRKVLPYVASEHGHR